MLKNILIKIFALSLFLAFLPLFAMAAGLVPCGGPNEEPCTICHFFVLVEKVTRFVVLKIVPLLASLAFVSAGAYLLKSANNPESVGKAKSALGTVLAGLFLIFTAWFALNIFFLVANVTKWSNLEKGWWKIKAVCVSTNPPPLGCGDSKVTSDEQCDPNEKQSECEDRTGFDPEKCEKIISSCTEDCLIPDSPCKKDAGIPDWDKLGMGCYLDTNGNGKIDAEECKKGKYVCEPDESEGGPKIICANVFGDPKYSLGKYQTEEYRPANDYTGKDGWHITDYCCENMMEEYADGKIGENPFTIVRATMDDIHLTGGATLYQAWGAKNVKLDNCPNGVKGGFNCDEVCKKYGKICVGVGLTDPSINACIYEIHDEQGAPPDAKLCNTYGMSITTMRKSENAAHNNCKAYFGFVYYSQPGERWSTAYDKYEYFCAKHDPRSHWATSHRNMLEVPEDSCGVCKPRPAPGATCTGSDYQQDPNDSCAFHGNDLGETACYCM